MPRCNYCLEFSDTLVYKTEANPPLVCESCAKSIDEIDVFLNNFKPDNYDKEEEKWENG